MPPYLIDWRSHEIGSKGQQIYCETRKKKRIFFSFFENEQISNPCRDGTNKTLDFSLDLR